MDARQQNNDSGGQPLSVAVLVEYFKALADETRLRILGLLATGERSVEELAALLDLRAPTVSHHLARLKQVGLVRVRVEGNTHFYALQVEALHQLKRNLPTPRDLAQLAGSADSDAWERKVLRDFLAGDRLKEIPAMRKKRSVILRWLAEQFEHGRSYTEVEVNALLQRYHEDSATLRRELVGEKLLARESGTYWRLPTERQPSPTEGSL